MHERNAIDGEKGTSKRNSRRTSPGTTTNAMQVGFDGYQTTAELQKKQQETLRKKWKRRTVKLATWNVQTMLQKKTNHVLKKTTRIIKIFGISEMRWRGNGELTKDGFYAAYSGSDDHIRGVGIIVHPSLTSPVENTWAVSDRVTVTEVNNLYQSICILQFYATTCDKDDAAVDRFHSDIEEALKKLNRMQVCFS